MKFWGARTLRDRQIRRPATGMEMQGKKIVQNIVYYKMCSLEKIKI